MIAPAATRSTSNVDVGRLRALIDRDGGFTVDVSSGSPVRRGISVCTRPGSSLRFRRCDWDDDGVAAWLAASLRPIPTAAHLGGWLDVDSHEVWLDVVTVVAPAFRQAAFALARTLRQHGVFDLERRQLVDLRVSAV